MSREIEKVYIVLKINETNQPKILKTRKNHLYSHTKVVKLSKSNISITIKTNRSQYVV